MKSKHTEEKLVTQIDKQTEKIEYLTQEVSELKAELTRKKDHESEVIYLRQKAADLVSQLEEVQNQFSNALEVIEELQRKTQIKSNNQEMQNLRERQISELAGNIEIQKLRIQFSAIVRQFKGEAGAYTAKDVNDKNLSNVVDENIKLRQKYHESQAQRVVLEQNLKSLQCKLEEYEHLIAHSPRLRAIDATRGTSSMEILKNLRGDAQIGKLIERRLSSNANVPTNTYGYFKQHNNPAAGETSSHLLLANHNVAGHSDSRETIFSKRRKDDRQKSVDLLTDDLISSLGRHNSMLNLNPQVASNNYLYPNDFLSSRGNPSSELLGVTKLNVDIGIGLDPRKHHQALHLGQALTTRVKMSTAPLNIANKSQAGLIGTKEIPKPGPSSLKNTLLLGLKKQKE